MTGPERHCQRQAGSLFKKLVEKKFGTPTHPTVAPRHKKGGGTHFLRRREQCSKKDNTVLHPQGKLANCGGLQKRIGVWCARVQATSQGVIGTRP